MDALYELLKENTELYKLFLELEYDKYAAVIKDDLVALDNIGAQEEVYYLKMKGLEHKREKLLNSLGLNGKTLKEIINSSASEYKAIFQKQAEVLNGLIKELQKINSLLKTVIEVRLRRMDEMTKKNDSLEGFFISQKI